MIINIYNLSSMNVTKKLKITKNCYILWAIKFQNFKYHHLIFMILKVHFMIGTYYSIIYF